MQLKNLINLIKRKSGMNDLDIADFLGCKVFVLGQMRRGIVQQPCDTHVRRLKRLLQIITKQRLSGEFPVAYFKQCDDGTNY